MDREDILDQIRRTADANGGVPLGRERFRRASGVRPYDWQKHWPTWGDAVREAGYAPNQLQAATPKDDLLEHLAAFVRELGRFPRVADLLVKQHRDPAFPSKNAILKHRTMGALASELQRFAQAKGYEDVAALCAPVAKPSARPERESARPSANEPLGTVYLIRSGRHYKIGRSNAVGRRERELAIQLPEQVKLVHAIRTDDPVGIEAYWHGRFKDRRKNGEWFALSPEDVAAFRRRVFM